MATPPTKPLTWFDFLDATWIALGLLTTGITAVSLGVPWDVVVPLALTVLTGFVGRLAGKAQAARALTALKAHNLDLAQELSASLDEQRMMGVQLTSAKAEAGELRADLLEVTTKLEAAAAEALGLRQQLRPGGH